MFLARSAAGEAVTGFPSRRTLAARRQPRCREEQGGRPTAPALQPTQRVHPTAQVRLGLEITVNGSGTSVYRQGFYYWLQDLSNSTLF